MSTLTVRKKTSYSGNCTVKENGSAIDITGQTILFTVKRKVGGAEDDSDALISKTLTSFSDPVNGVFLLELTDTETNIPYGTYVADFKRIDGSTLVGYSSVDFVVAQTVTQRSS